MSRAGRDDGRTGIDSGNATREGRARKDLLNEYDPGQGLALPRSDVRESVHLQDRTYELRGSESRMLATVGAFRVVPAADLEDDRSSRDVWHGDAQRLAEQGLLTRTRVMVDGQPTAVIALTREGKALLDVHRREPDREGQQQFHARLVKPRELAHDVQLYRLFQAEAKRIEDEGGQVRRVVLDYELKRDYQRFLRRPRRADETEQGSPAHAFAEAHRLPVSPEGRLELPDLRIEYEGPDGRLEVRDLELVTEHYSRAQMSSKARAGFTLYRTGSAGTGGTPFDPRHVERLG